MRRHIQVLLVLFSLMLSASLAFSATLVEVRVNKGDDDAEERVSDGYMYLTSTDLELVVDSSAQIIGMRFESVPVPTDANILNAYVDFVVDETGNSDGTLTIYGELNSSPETFSATHTVSGRTKTTASKTWELDSSNEWESVNDRNQTPELKTIIQEIIDGTGWSENDSMAIIIEGTTGKRVAESFNGDPDEAPLLVIIYDEGTPKPFISLDPEDEVGVSSYEETNASDTTFILTNDGTKDLEYEITSDKPWVSCSSGCSGTLGTTDADNSVTVNLTFDTYLMDANNYTANVTITDKNNEAPNSPFEYGVNLEILEQPVSNTCGDVPIYAQDLVNPAVLVLLDVSSSMNSYMDVSSGDDNPQSADLKPIIEEFLGSSSWSQNDPMMFIITGTGKRVANSYDGSSSGAPLLHIEYKDTGVESIFETRIDSSNDDVEQRNDGSMYWNSSDLELITDGSSQEVGLRFTNVNIPKDAVITSAYIEFTIDEVGSADTDLTFKGAYPDFAGGDDWDTGFEDVTDYLTNMDKTSASVPWNDIEAWSDSPEKQRYVIGREVISDLMTDTTIAWGYGTWAFSQYDGPGTGVAPDLDLLPLPYGDSELDLYTKIHAGVKSRTLAETTDLQTIVEATTTTSGTPFGPSLLAANAYFAGEKGDLDGVAPEKYDDTLECQPKFLIDVTDGLGYSPHTSVSIINTYANMLADNGISTVAVGFGIDNATQIAELAEVANTRGNADDDLYALHEEVAGVGQPFIAQNQVELTEALETITSSIKEQIFIGSSPAPSTSVNTGTFVINASFNAANWSGDLTATPYDPETGAIDMCVDVSGNETCDAAVIVGRCVDDDSGSCDVGDIKYEECICWTASDEMPVSKNAWTVSGDNSYDGTGITSGMAGFYVDDHSSLGLHDIGLDGDNFICTDLGDIIKSTPVISEPPKRYYSYDNYRYYRFGSMRNRDKMLYVGANDGALHAFNLATGVEEWRFYPEALHQKIIDEDLCSETYCHEYFVDATPVVTDVFTGTDNDDVGSGESGWRTVLISGLGEGGDSFFALDVTSAKTFLAGNTDHEAGTMYLWQFTDDELGFTQGIPTVARVDASEATYGGWMAYFGSGNDVDGSSYKEAYVYGIDPYTKEARWKDPATMLTFNRLKLEETDRITYSGQSGTEFTAGEIITGKDSTATATISSVDDSGTEGTLYLTNISGDFVAGERLYEGDVADGDDRAAASSPAHSRFYQDALSDSCVADLDFDHISDYLYFGNMYGRIYRISDIGKDDDPQAGILFAIDNTTENHNTPIRAGGSIGYDSLPSTVWVYFGTGRFEDDTDKYNTEQQYFLGIKDNLASPVTNSTLDDLLPRHTIAVTSSVSGESAEYRVMTGRTYAFEGSATITVGNTMEGKTSGATGVVKSVDTSSTPFTIEFEDGDFVTNGLFDLQEKVYDVSDDTQEITLVNHSWYSTLQSSVGIPSERVVARSLVVGGIVFFTSFIPDEDVCGGNGTAWLFALDYQTGLATTEPVFDLNGDGEYDENDVVSHDGKTYNVAAIPIGRGIPSAPVNEDGVIFVNTTDNARPGIPANIPQLSATLSSWKDGGF